MIERLLQVQAERSLELRKIYDMNPVTCLYCASPIEFKRRFNTKFCNAECRKAHTQSKIKKDRFGLCKICSKPISRKGRLYCSNKCNSEYVYREYIERWLLSLESGNKAEGTVVAISNYVRRWALEKAGHKCQQCGWAKVNPTTGKIPLHIHHKDGNAYNSSPSNIEVLCPSCHAITPNYGVYGMGRKRKPEQVNYKNY